MADTERVTLMRRWRLHPWQQVMILKGNLEACRWAAGKFSSDYARLLQMLQQAMAMHSYQKLGITSSYRQIMVHTGPDDAVAVFLFGEDGVLASVSVVESDG
jgi:hypothetical protein